jgi:hypothetical protein
MYVLGNLQMISQRKQINTIKLPQAITATNTDGTINAGGKITNMVRLRMKIQDHEEIIEFWVTDIGQKDLFISHDWLQHHNPEINWQEKQIKFSRCLGDCYKESNIDEPEDEINQEKNDEFDSKEDRLLAIDIDLPELNQHL